MTVSTELETTDRIFFDKFYEWYCPMKQSCPSICPIDYCTQTKIDEEPLIERFQPFLLGTVQMQVLVQKFARKNIVV